MKFFTKWAEVYTISNQEASSVADAMLTNFFCPFGVSLELHSDQSRIFESRLMQVVLERLSNG
jgi:hypothetical protein